MQTARVRRDVIDCQTQIRGATKAGAAPGLKRWLAAVALAFFGLSTPAGAVERWHSGTVKWIYTGTDGWIVLTFAEEPASCLSTQQPKYMYIAVGASGVTATGAKQMLSTAMLAFATGRTLTVNFDDATPNCYINRLYITN